jgi:hypothetical protein
MFRQLVISILEQTLVGPESCTALQLIADDCAQSGSYESTWFLGYPRIPSFGGIEWQEAITTNSWL